MEPFNAARFAHEITPEQAAALIAGNAEPWQQSIVLERMREGYERARIAAYGTPEPVPADWPITLFGLASVELAKAICKAQREGSAWPLIQWCESSASVFELQRFSPAAVSVWLAREGLPSACDFGQGLFDTYRPWLPPAPAAPDAGQLSEPIVHAAPIDGGYQTSPALQRQAARWQACIDAGLAIDANTFAPLPRGIGKVAKRLRITRQALAEDLRAYRERLASTQNGRQNGK